MAKEEVDTLSKLQSSLEDRAKIQLLPKDPLDDKNIMLEVRKKPPVHSCQLR